jgi:hypothetical protein
VHVVSASLKVPRVKTIAPEAVRESPRGSPMAVASAQLHVSTRPHTSLQQGIRKPKVCMDGTLRYANLTTSGEPCSVQEAGLGSSTMETSNGQ